MAEQLVHYGLLAEFDSADDVLRAAEQVRDAGYRRAEAFTPFPVEGLAETLGFHRTAVAPIALVAGILGAATGFFMCWYANVVSYPWNIGGWPNNSWPAWIPITFELMVLFAALSAAFSMLILNGLPRLHHPVFEAPPFLRASRDRFFLLIEATDPQFDESRTREFLTAIAPPPLSITLIPNTEVHRV